MPGFQIKMIFFFLLFFLLLDTFRVSMNRNDFQFHSKYSSSCYPTAVFGRIQNKFPTVIKNSIHVGKQAILLIRSEHRYCVALRLRYN